ncbi:MAG: hypothetical protein Q9220_003016 [cf. Caloplaca sp. 1 TL-2023]
MNSIIPLALRGFQLLFAIISLGLNAYLVDTFTGPFSNSPSRVNFMLFNSIWTLIPALPFLALAPRFLSASSPANMKVVYLAVDALTALFWFAGFIALAVWYNDLDYCFGRVCGVIVASCVFGAFEWLLFTATAVLSGLDFWRTRSNTSAPKTAPETTTV